MDGKLLQEPGGNNDNIHSGIRTSMDWLVNCLQRQAGTLRLILQQSFSWCKFFWFVFIPLRLWGKGKV
jgi:hypothetical protein